MKSLIALLVLFSSSAFALETGMPAPEFTLPGLNTKMKEIKLSDFKGKLVVLEWLNHGCPFVRKHYDSGNMQALQKKYVEKNIIWLSIISSAPGKQGHVDASMALEDKVKYKSAATDVLLDPAGKVGRLYGAKTTPHMFIIGKDGTLLYQGAIDDKPDTDKDSLPSAKNYVNSALEEVLAKRPVTRHTTNSYGCSVKYQD
jgi:AhpC/TSA family